VRKRHSHAFSVRVYGAREVHRFTHRHELFELVHRHIVETREASLLATDPARYYDEERKPATREEP